MGGRLIFRYFLVIIYVYVVTATKKKNKKRDTFISEIRQSLYLNLKFSLRASNMVELTVSRKAILKIGSANF